MNASELLRSLQEEGVQLWREGEELRYRAPKRLLSVGLIEALAARKPEIVQLLQPLPVAGPCFQAWSPPPSDLPGSLSAFVCAAANVVPETTRAGQLLTECCDGFLSRWPTRRSGTGAQSRRTDRSSRSLSDHVRRQGCSTPADRCARQWNSACLWKSSICGLFQSPGESPSCKGWSPSKQGDPLPWIARLFCTPRFSRWPKIATRFCSPRITLWSMAGRLASCCGIFQLFMMRIPTAVGPRSKR